MSDEKSGRPKGGLIDALRARPVVFDGAMGTAIYERGVLFNKNFDHLNITRPDLVEEVHQAHLGAGAEVLQTNTFGANRHRLASHTLEGEVEAINAAGVQIARKVAGDIAWVVGSMGPSGAVFKAASQKLRDGLFDVFREQAAALAAEGVDGIALETYRHPEELKMAIEGARAGTRGGIPVIASVSFDTFGTLADGTQPEKLAKMLADWGADAIGVNCADGPAGVYEMATRMLDAGLPVIAQPNAGLPHRVDGRFAYMATPEYFLVYGRRLFKAGVSGVGGCCGTTAAHIRQIVGSARMLRGEAGGVVLSTPGESGPPGPAGQSATRPPGPIVEIDTSVSAPGVEIAALADKGMLGAKLATKDFIVSVEINPPAGLSLDKALRAAKKLKEGGVDVINVADGARATARMGNLALCHRIEREVGMPALMHVTTRDRNVLGLVAHLLAAHELDVKNLVVITGDPPKMGDFPDATPVYDLDSVGLLRLVRGLNRGFDPGGRPMLEATSFLCATGVEPAAADYDRELSRLEAKSRAGAEVVMTQPVYDLVILERFLKDVASMDLAVLVGLLPLASSRNAEFLHNEVPGMQIPATIRERMEKAGGGPKGRAEGITIAREMLEAVKERARGAYIMPPFGRHQSALAVIDGIVR